MNTMDFFRGAIRQARAGRCGPGATRCRRWAGVAATAAALLYWPAATAADWQQAEWIEVRSAGFVTYSELPAQATQRIVANLEALRQTTSAVVGTKFDAGAIPTRLFLLAHSYPGIDTDGRTSAWFEAGLRSNYAVAHFHRRNGGLSSLRHYYGRYVVRRSFETPPPVWFEEGLTLFLVSAHSSGTSLNVGLPYWYAWDLTRTAQMDETDPFERGGRSSRIVDEGIQRPRFAGSTVASATLLDRPYVDFDGAGGLYRRHQAWRLVHHLIVGRNSRVEFNSLQDYARLHGSGLAPDATLEQAFGLTLEEIDTGLRENAQEFAFVRLDLRNPLPEPLLQTRPLPAAEIAIHLGRVALVQDSIDDALAYFAFALRQDPKSCDALAGMGAAHLAARHYDLAERQLLQAAALHPKDEMHELDLGSLYVRAADNDLSDDGRHEYLVKARRHLARSFELYPANPETLTMNGLTYRYSPDENHKAIASLEAAVRLLPTHESPRLALVRAYRNAHRLADARRQLIQLLAWADAGEQYQLQEILAEIDAAMASESPSDRPAVALP